MEINHQPLTRGHKTLGDKWLAETLFSHQGSLCLDSEVASKPQRFIPPTVSKHYNAKIDKPIFMRYFYLLLLFVTFSCYSQDKSIEILLKTDNIITTDWIELHDFPFFQSPFIKIHNLDGPKIKIRNIQNYKGYDQYGNYRQLDVIDFNDKRKYYFTERKFQLDSTGKVKIYFDQLIFGLSDNSWKFKNVKYSLNNGEIRKLSYRNVKNDLIDINISDNNLKKANHIRIIQFISIGIGAALLADVLIENWDPTDTEFKNKESSLKFIASGLLLTFPFTLEKPKQKRLLKVLRNYQ